MHAMRQLALLLGIVCLASAQTEICTAGDYNIEPLVKPGYWQITLAEANCRHFGFDECTLFLAFCQELPSSISGCDTSEDVLGPTSLCVTNGTVGYSMGAYDDNMNPFRMSINSSELVAQWDNGSSTVECLAALTTNILFECNAYDTWEGNPGLGYGEASSYLLNFFVNFDDPCGVVITLGYSKICEPAECKADGHHDIKTLSRPDYWVVSNIPEGSCREFFESSQCTMYISFCKPISGVGHCEGLVNTSVCITNGTTSYSLGVYNYLVNPFVSFTNDTILAAYSNGTHNPKCPSTYTNDAGSIVTLKCDLGATWRQSGSTGDASDHFEGLLVNPQDGCLVFVEFSYSGACSGQKRHSSSSNDNDKVGWPGLIIMLVLAVTVTLYLIIGSAVNISKGKSTCPEMLPQYDFWKAFFKSAIEGVFFTADLVTCGFCTRQIGPSPTSEYEKL